MKPRIIPCVILLALAAHSAIGETIDLSKVPEPTMKLYAKLKAEFTGLNEHSEADAKLIANLAAAPGGDLCFLDAFREPWIDRITTPARKELGELNTQRTYDIAAAGLRSKKSLDRNRAIGEMSAFDRPESEPLFLAMLNSDPEESVRTNAAGALKVYADPKIAPDLLKAARAGSYPMTLAALGALAPLKSSEGLAMALGLLQKSEKQKHEDVIQLVASYHNKAAVKALLAEYKRLAPDDAAGWNARIRHDIDSLLHQCADHTPQELLPWPDERLDEWEDWWARADPLVTDDLQPKTVKPPPRQWRHDEFAKTLDATTFAAQVDAKIYRVGEPIRLDLALTNTGAAPVNTIPPGLPSGWYPTMAYGITLKRGDTTLIKIVPSDFYLGSYSGPPAFKPLLPGESFQSSICFQHWIENFVSLPLSQGDYQLEITFDSSKFSGIKPSGLNLVHRWNALPMKFTIKGDPLKEPQEILAAIAEKTGKKFLIADLASPQPERHDPAWWIIFEYGDSRLETFVEQWEKAHPDRTYGFLKAKNLRPWERKSPASAPPD